MNSNQPKLMISGCCVCSDERGWSENPLVYCDGDQCSVAIHQACYGIKNDELKESEPWYCRKCQSHERHVKVKCELCPSKDGAFKRTSNSNWAHVICSLYIPEVRFGNVTTMEPIILSSIPSERFHKTCCICEERGKEVKSRVGACMQCNKGGCKQYFHVTCAQACGLLCEVAGNSNDNVKYCGYCKYHYLKLKKDTNIKFIPAFKPIKSFNRLVEKNDSSLDKKSSNHHNSDTSKPPKRKQKFYSTSSQHDSDTDGKPEKTKKKRTSSISKDTSGSSSNKHNSSKESSHYDKDDDSDDSSDDSIIVPSSKKSKETSSKFILDSDTDEDEDVSFNIKKSKNDQEKKKGKRSSSSSKSKESDKPVKENKKVKKRKEESNSKKDKEETISKTSSKVDDKKSEEKQSSVKTNQNLNAISEKSTTTKNSSSVISSKEQTTKDNEIDQVAQLRNELPKQDFHLPELIKHKSFLDENESSKKSHNPPATLEEFLERQWIQNSQFLLEQSQFFDISSLISCLYQLKSENRFLDDKLKGLIQRRDHLIAVNSRLSLPLSTAASSLDNLNWETSNNNLNQLAIATSTINSSTTASNDQASATNLFFPNQNALSQQPNFSSIHNNTTTSTPSPNTSSQQQQQQKQHQQSNHPNFFNLNHVNNLNGSLNNQSYNNKSMDLNSNLSNSFLDLNNQLNSNSSANSSSNLKQQTNNFTFNNGLFQAAVGQAVNGQFNNNSLNLNTATSSPSKLNQFNSSLTNSANNNLLPFQLFQNINQNSQAFCPNNKR